MDALLNSPLLSKIIPSAITLAVVILTLWSVHWLTMVRNSTNHVENKVPKQIALLLLTIAGLIAFIISLPIEESLRNQIIGLIGIILSGLIAFSSTNIVANLMAGMLLRITKPFGIGDFVKVDGYFGRVSERGLFDTEIQSENRELIALPNSFLANNPVTRIQATGAIVSATLSLGYDVHHRKVEPLLIMAAEKSGLNDAFVHIIELGDFSVSYRVSGFLTEAKGIISARSNLQRDILDTLHDKGIEIMSPTYMNQRPQDTGSTTIPKNIWRSERKDNTETEQLVFDKAEKAQQLSQEIKQAYDNISKLEEEVKDSPEERKSVIKQEIAALQEQVTSLKTQSKDIDSDATDEEDNSAQAKTTQGENKKEGDIK